MSDPPPPAPAATRGPGDEPHREMPMFPLSSVLWPGQVLPLHVFEARYRALIAACLAMPTDPTFGVVLIERGREVGGGDARFPVGVSARILRVQRTPRDTLAVTAFGVRRFRVVRWVGEDPYPRAEIEWWDDEPEAVTASDALEVRPHGHIPSAAELAARVRRAWAAAVELGDIDASQVPRVGDDPRRWPTEIPALAPAGPIDQYRLLSAPGLGARLERLSELLDEVEMLQRLRLGG